MRACSSSISAALLLMIAILCCYPARFDVEARGTLEPTERKEIFALEDGVVAKVHVTNLTRVRKEDVLLELENPELEVQLREYRGRRDAARQELRSTTLPRVELLKLNEEQRTALLERRQTWLAQLGILDGQVRQLEARQARLTVTSPMDGQVIQWRVDEELANKPVQRGEPLLRIFNPDGEWELELAMPEERMGHLQSAVFAAGPDEHLDVSYILATNPTRVHHGRLRSIHQTAELDAQEGHTVRLRIADLDEDELGELRAGAGVIGDVHCGHRPLGYVWFHEAGEWLQKTWFYYF